MTAGLEPAAAAEVRRLGGPEPLSAARGAVRVPGDLRLGARLALGLRSAPRVILELATALPGEADGFQPALSRIAWEEWLPRELSWAVRVTGTTEELRSPLHTARLVKDSVRDRFTARGLACPPVDPRGARVLVDFRLERGTASAGIDLGGHSLHARGTGRQGPAPLREDVAAGLALLAGVDAERALLDPFCGTGTLIAEAAALALGIPPNRPPATLAVSALPPFTSLPLEAIARELEPERIPLHAPFLASDRNPRAIAEARAALDRQGLARHVELECAEVETVEPPDGPGLVLTNPPWGLRLADEAAGAWRGLGTLARQRLSGWTIAALSGNAAITRHLGFKAERRIPLTVSGIEARLLVYAVRSAPRG